MRRKSKRTFGRSWGALTLIVVLAALVSLLGAGTALAANHWTDITDQQWVNVYGVTATQAATVAAGYDNGTFKPAQAIPRAQFAKMVVDGLGLGTAHPLVRTFSDVPVTNYYFPWVEGAHSAQIISGYDDGTFRPTASISRQGADSILGLYLSQRELFLTGHIQGAMASYSSVSAWYAAEGAEFLDAFADADLFLPVHAPYAAYLAYHHVLAGSARTGGVYLDPGSSLTRAQAVTLILRVEGVTFASAPTVTAVSPTGQPTTAAGTAVTVTGTNFLAGATVAFGGTAATGVVVVSSTSITCVSPAHAVGVVDVTVTTSAGTSVTSAADKYTYGTAATKYVVTSSSYSPVAGATVTISAQLTDANGNPVSTAGHVVTWTKSDTHGSFATPTSTTDANGIATVVFTTHTVAGTVTTVTGTDAGSLTGISSSITTV